MLVESLTHSAATMLQRALVDEKIQAFIRERAASSLTPALSIYSSRMGCSRASQAAIAG